MDQYLFHGIFACSIERDTSPVEAEIMKDILNFKIIASRKILKTLLSEEDYYKRIIRRPTGNWNGDTYVSISTHVNRLSLFPGHFSGKVNNECLSSYKLYIQFKPAMILDSKLLKELPVCKEPANNMPGEIQVKDKIAIDYFVGITLPYASPLDSFFDYIWKVSHLKNDYELIDYNSWYMDAKEDLLKLSEEEFINKYYKRVMLFEEVLKETGSSLKLYYIDGRPILTSEERIEQIAKIKEKCF